MKIVLVQSVKNLGEKGDIVELADGYAHNFILPKKIGKKATPDVLKWAEGIIAERVAQKEEIAAKAKEFVEKIKKTTLKFKRKTTKNGKKLFGAVSEKDIAEELEKTVKIHLEKKQIKMKHHIKEIGISEVEIHLSEDINTVVKVEVEAEE